MNRWGLDTIRMRIVGGLAVLVVGLAVTAVLGAAALVGLAGLAGIFWPARSRPPGPLALSGFALASFAAGFKKEGMLTAMPEGVSPENVKFVEEHEAELTALQKKWEAMSKGVKP